MRAGSDAYTLPAVPALWRVWQEAGVLRPSIRLAISAGAPLPLQLEGDVFERCELKIHNFYGATECGGIAYDRSLEPRSDGTCVGSAMQNVSLSVGRGRRLEVRGAAVGQSYWPKRSNDLRDGVFRTTDIVEITNGSVFLRGRSSDQINVAGRKVLPETIENVLLSHKDVRECVVFGVASSRADRGERIVACIGRKKAVSKARLHDFAAERLSSWQVPRDWWFLEEFPKTARGKISRSELRNQYLRLQREQTTQR